jgi:hypothetical protein
MHSRLILLHRPLCRDQLPVMLCTRWLPRLTQPIAVDDLLAYLLVAKDMPPSESRTCRDDSFGRVRVRARRRELAVWV